MSLLGKGLAGGFEVVEESDTLLELVSSDPGGHLAVIWLQLAQQGHA